MDLLKRLEGTRLALVGLAVAAVLFFAVNIIAGTSFRGLQLDLTENHQFTLSDGTRKVLAKLDEPVRLSLYYSRNLGQTVPEYAAYQSRVQALLEQYVDVADGKLILTTLDPAPFTDAEDRAVAEGLQGIPITTGGDFAYFGLVAANSTDGRDAIRFFNREREPFLEYDLTKLIEKVSTASKPVLGVMSSIDLPQGPGDVPPRRTVTEQLADFFTVEPVDIGVDNIPPNIEVLLILQPDRIGATTAQGINAFVRRGGRLMVFLDPLHETGAGAARKPDFTEINKLFEGWGVRLVDGKIAGDLDAARRVATGTGEDAVVADYVAWLSLSPDNVDQDEPIFANISRLNVATSGLLEPVDGAHTTVTPLIFTGPHSMAIDVDRIGMMPDLRGLLRSFQSGNKPLWLAARVTGEVPATVGTPADAAAAGDYKPIDAIIVADVDMLEDRFWLSSSDFFGNRVGVPTANNGDFVINALENLGGSTALADLRGRGMTNRPFVLFDDLEHNAEQHYRQKEKALQERLKALEGEISAMRHTTGPDGELVLSAEEKQKIARFRSDMSAVRRELRDVQLALRSDIERVEDTVEFVNIALVPILLAVGALVFAIIKRWRRARAVRAAANMPA